MLFGAGVAILLRRSEEARLPGHFARMAALAVIALAHAILLANNDVLRSYAVAGVALPFVIRWPVRRLLWIAAAIIAGQLAVSGWIAWEWLRVYFSAVPNPAAMAQAEQMFGADPQMIAAALDRGQETFGERMDRRLTDPAIQLRTVLAALPSTFAAMLVGVALWRARLLAGGWSAARLLRLARLLALVTVLPLLAMAVWSIVSDFNPIVTAFNALIASAPFDILLGISYAALAMALFGGAFREWRGTGRWAAVGRLALTNYLATSLIFAALFAAWGLGLFGKITRAEALLLGLVPIAGMLIWSPLWLKRFRQGPAEWLWRSLATGRFLPLRR